ncbi:YlzJ-like family protein [Virgibacillus sp. SK37]|uniref:YlzJ-like family protein n=1 Tax=Virgibacillus sp. SK37 TaxID=403957 RepID=UPI0004D1931E|nr:YlzJ-like family protein [Virgibacillus sp. SK37]AIF43706.1 hypothetical protein X953_11625 [Virgibacillus sp. SK37]
MILYTPLTQEEIFPEEENTNREYISYEGRTICVNKTADGEYQLVQLLSTDPQDFLNDKYTPGRILP